MVERTVARLQLGGKVHGRHACHVLRRLALEPEHGVRHAAAHLDGRAELHVAVAPRGSGATTRRWRRRRGVLGREGAPPIPRAELILGEDERQPAAFLDALVERRDACVAVVVPLLEQRMRGQEADPHGRFHGTRLRIRRQHPRDALRDLREPDVEPQAPRAVQRLLIVLVAQGRGLDRHWLALRGVARQQGLEVIARRPPLSLSPGLGVQRRRELPREVVGILDARVHAKAAGRGEVMRGVPREQHATARRLVRLGDASAHHPRTH
mmetsp:Transcript_25892/g.81060  ORF Transcript_25892/g.81060 Transcript_25892/m.81060 type:complete len:267 (-) Transcript_25892:856-1656(-)